MSAVKVLLHVRCSDLGFVKRLPEMCLVARPLNAHNRRSRAFFDWFVDGALPKDGPSLRWWCSFRNDGRPSPPQCSHPAVRGWSFGDSSHSRSGFVDIRARAGENAKVRFQKPRTCLRFELFSAWKTSLRRPSWSRAFRQHRLREGKRCGVGSRASGWQQLLKNDTCYFIGGTL